MSNKILTFSELTNGKTYTFIGTSGEYESNKLVKDALFSSSNVTKYHGIASWYLGLNDVFSADEDYFPDKLEHRTDLPIDDLSQRVTGFQIIQKDPSTLGINNTPVWTHHSPEFFNTASVVYPFYYNSDIVYTGNNSFKNLPILADTEISNEDEYSVFDTPARSVILGGIRNLNATSLYNTLANHYIIPICQEDYDNYGYLNFFDSDNNDGTGYMDVYVTSESSSKVFFAKYNYYDYYVKGTYNGAQCIFNCRLRYLGQPRFDEITNPVTEPDTSSTYYYGTAGEIFGDETLNYTTNCQPIGYVYVAYNYETSGVDDASLVYYEGSDYVPYIVNSEGEKFTRLYNSIIYSGTLTVNGITYPVYDIRQRFINGYATDGYAISEDTGDSDDSADDEMSDVTLKFVNFLTNHDINVWRVDATDEENPKFSYVTKISKNLGTCRIPLTVKEVNDTSCGFAFTTADTIYERNAATIVTIVADQLSDYTAYYSDNYDEYLFESIGGVVSYPGLPLYDATLTSKCIMYVPAENLLTYSGTYQDEDGFIGLSYCNNRMSAELDTEPYDGYACDMYLHDNNGTSIQEYEVGDSIIYPEDGNYNGYIDYQLSFGSRVSFYYNIHDTVIGNDYYYQIPINGDDMILDASTLTKTDALRGACIYKLGDGLIYSGITFNDKYLHIKNEDYVE